MINVSTAALNFNCCDDEKKAIKKGHPLETFFYVCTKRLNKHFDDVIRENKDHQRKQ